MKRILIKVICLVLFLLTSLHSKSKEGSYVSSSVLSTGQWLKIAVVTDGVYRLDYSSLKQKGFTDLSHPRIFCSNTGQLSYYNDGTAPDDLQEMAIYVSTGNDGIFNDGDYLLFYGMGTHRWNFDPVKKDFYYLRHNYSDTAFYFITTGNSAGKSITDYIEPASNPVYSSSVSDALFSLEEEGENLIKSGREWFQKASPVTEISINPGFTGVVTPGKLKISVRVAARSASVSGFKLFEVNNLRKEIILPSVNLFNTTGIQAAIADSTWFLDVSSSSPLFSLKFDQRSNISAAGWLDYVRLTARVRNVFEGKTAVIMDSESVAPGMITSFSVETSVSNAVIWDISDPLNIKNITYNKIGNTISFKSSTDLLRKYVIFLSSDAKTPEIRGSSVSNQDIHSSAPAEMIIITHPAFQKYAFQLADLHLKNSGLTSQVVTTNQVYNEFSGGIPDIVALRNFIRMKYLKQKGTSTPLKYLLLFGDGSFENKTPPPGNPNYIPTYQSQNSNIVVSSFTSDDFYGLLDAGEGEAEGTEDIGIGRLPVSDTIQASVMISKIKRYLDPSNFGDWKNIITLTADDEDGNAHMTDAEGLELALRQKAPEYNIEKIYLDAFRQKTSVNGQSYPDVTKAINERLNKGCLIFNYTGHGNELYLANEAIIKSEDYLSWKNGGKLPLFITATCEFSRFDDIEITALGDISEKTSAGEMILLSEPGGAIALMSTTRVVFSAPNFFLNRNILNCAFDRDSSGNSLRLGDIIRIAKNNSGSGTNKRNFSLLGDPAVKLAYPWHGKVITDSVNHIHVSSGTDSLKALSKISVSGHIEGSNGSSLNNFNGIVSPVVYDKESKLKTLANDGGSVIEFNLRNNILFSGQTKARNGMFSYSFMVPRDINYSYGNGRISYYAHDDTSDMNGYFSDIIVGGFSESAITDTTGPKIRLFMNDTLFHDGGMTDDNPVLLAIIEDPAGINITGSGIGHDLTGRLDTDLSVILNENYVNDFDTYTKGRMTYKISDLSEGEHSFTVKAWDYFNNSTEETIKFRVEKSKKIILNKLFNYPNPLVTSTYITGEINRPDVTISITLCVYSSNGLIIKTLTKTVMCTGYMLPPVEWNGFDDGGNKVNPGLYPYIVTVRTDDGEVTRASGKMIIL
ncbi:MAG TPA: type IX secretion system sortase PorU [Bacteroidales bacterium]|nr:type IX secretion system sortase PorU [Bacteroidales bacterium]